MSNRDVCRDCGHESDQLDSHVCPGTVDDRLMAMQERIDVLEERANAAESSVVYLASRVLRLEQGRG